jgi:hypothetical protein
VSKNGRGRREKGKTMDESAYRKSVVNAYIVGVETSALLTMFRIEFSSIVTSFFGKRLMNREMRERFWKL